MGEPVKLKKGEAPTLMHAEFANEHVMIPLHALRNMTVSPMGAGKLIMQGEKAVLQLDLKAIAAAAIIPLAPYQLGPLSVGLRYGVINDRLAVPHPLDSYGPFAITATRYFFAKVTTDGEGLPTGVQAHHQATLTPPAASDTVSYKYLGRAVVTSGAISAIEPAITGSQNYERVGYSGNYSHYFEAA